MLTCGSNSFWWLYEADEVDRQGRKDALNVNTIIWPFATFRNEIFFVRRREKRRSMWWINFTVNPILIKTDEELFDERIVMEKSSFGSPYVDEDVEVSHKLALCVRVYESIWPKANGKGLWWTSN